MENEERRLHVRLPAEVYKKLKTRCVYEDTSMQEYVAGLIAESMGLGMTVSQRVQGRRLQRKPAPTIGEILAVAGLTIQE
jgi:hypothetical protein